MLALSHMISNNSSFMVYCKGYLNILFFIKKKNKIKKKKASSLNCSPMCQDFIIWGTLGIFSINYRYLEHMVVIREHGKKIFKMYLV